MRTYLLLTTLCLAFTAYVSSALAQFVAAPEEEAVMCTMDAMECPDGSFVGRTGPNCEFVCPIPSSSAPLPTDASNDPVPPANPTRPTFELPPEDAISDDVTDVRAALASAKQERIINLAANISNRMEAAIHRLFNIIDRLETRVGIMKQKGLATETAETSLRLASQTLAEAEGLMSDIDNLVYTATVGLTPASDWQAVRTRYTEVAAKIRETQRLLREVVSLLKQAVVTESNIPTITDEPLPDAPVSL